MKQATRNIPRKKEADNTAVSSGVRRRLSEGLLILLVAISLYFLLALATYHNSDPGWSSSGTGGFIANAGGRLGAWFSDLFLYIFGYIAYLFPIMLAFSAWGIFRGEFILHGLKARHVLLRLFGFVLTLASACGLCGLYLSLWHRGVPLDAGGMFGDIVSSNLANILNPIGTGLILVAAFLIGVTLFTGISWLVVSRELSKGLLLLSIWLKNCFKRWCEVIKERRAARQAAMPVITEQKLIAKPKEVIEKPIKRDKQSVLIHQARQAEKAKVDYKITGTLPSVSLLNEPKHSEQQCISQDGLQSLSREIEARLKDFDIEVSVVAVHPGPIVTLFELDLAPGIKASKITALAKDLARALSVGRVRVVEVIPGKTVVGLEVPNQEREIVYLREIFESQRYVDAKSPLSLGLGKDISGYPVVVDLAKMPHLLVAGTTGAGKSVSLNAMLLSMLYKATPDKLRLILIDPKMLELGSYDGIPHLLTPVVTDMKEAANAFRWCVAEMDRRYQIMAAMGVRSIDTYNAKVEEAIKAGKPLPNPFATEETEEALRTLKPYPYIVVAVDEMSDMMMVVGKKVEELIARIAQKARAAGIHMILATQRPSVDVITGLIKANIPTRIAFQVSARVDSRTILDQQGAEQLLGYGDMLYLPPGLGLPMRVHGAFVTDDEIHRVVKDWKQRAEPHYLEAVTQGESESDDFFGEGGEGSSAELDELYDQAVQIVTESRRASISFVQRRLRIGYNRSANLLDAMEAAGVVSTMESNGTREVLAPPPVEE